MTDRICLVTGASRGIGRQLATDLANEGNEVIFVARDASLLDDAVRSVAISSPRSRSAPCDVRDGAQVAQVVRDVLQQSGHIDVLVNAAGIETVAQVSEMEVSEVAEVMDTNFMGMVRFTKAVLPDMLERRSGSIVNLSSTAGRVPLPGDAAYCATKAAITAFSESLYLEVAKQGVQVLIVYPGFVPDTEMAQAHIRLQGAPPRAVHQSLETVSKRIRESIGTRRFQLTLPPWVALSSIAKDLAPRLVLSYAAKTQVTTHG
jgi:hypothetical protein